MPSGRTIQWSQAELDLLVYQWNVKGRSAKEITPLLDGKDERAVWSKIRTLRSQLKHKPQQPDPRRQMRAMPVAPGQRTIPLLPSEGGAPW